MLKLSSAPAYRQNVGMNSISSTFLGGQAGQTLMHEVLLRMASQEHLKREDFSALAELMPSAAAIGAAAMDMELPTFLERLNTGGFKPLPVLLAMAERLQSRSKAH